MSDEDEKEDNEEEAERKKPSLIKTVIAGLGGAVGLGAIAAAAVFFIPTGEQTCTAGDEAAMAEKYTTKRYENIVFVNLKPLVVTLGPEAKAEFLKVSISIETSSEHVKTATSLQPRFRDVINTYLRSVDESDLVNPKAMTRLRAQLLRRLQVTASRDIVSDVLITDFVLN